MKSARNEPGITGKIWQRLKTGRKTWNTGKQKNKNRKNGTHRTGFVLVK
ncbi:MAG TPA: hypothetical protein VKA38_12175 [Draconibacterium sp.]|nr:hypothetical protein [Draconibacterium sp.]